MVTSPPVRRCPNGHRPPIDRRPIGRVVAATALALVLLALTPPPPVAVQAAPTVARFERLSRFGGPSMAVATRGEWALVGRGAQVELLRIDPFGEPVLEAVVPTRSRVVDIDWQGDVAVVLEEDHRIGRLEIASPPALTLRWAWTPPQVKDHSFDIVRQLGPSLLLAGNAGVAVVDLSDPAEPRWRGLVTQREYVLDVAVRAPYAFVADGLRGLQVLDLGDPRAPRVVHSLQLSEGYATSLVVVDDLLHAFVERYVRVDTLASRADRADRTADVPPKRFHLTTIDIGDPRTARELAQLDISQGIDTSIDDLVFDGERLLGLITLHCLHCFYGGLIELDLTTPERPTLADERTTFDEAATEIALAGGHLLAVHGSGNLSVFDAARAGPPTLVDRRLAPVRPRAIAADERRVVVGDGQDADGFGSPFAHALLHLRRRPGPALSLDGRLALGRLCGAGCRIALRGDHAFVADRNLGLLVVDLADPRRPRVVAREDPVGSPERMALTPELALLLVRAPEGGGGPVLEIYDTQVPDRSQRVATLAGLAPGARDVVVGADPGLAVVAGSKGVQLVDVSLPAAPVIVGQLEVGVLNTHVAVAGEVAHLVEFDGRMHSVDIHDPTRPRLLSSQAMPPSGAERGILRAVAAREGVLYTLFSERLQALDVHDPSRPYAITRPVPLEDVRDGDLIDMAMHEDRLFVLDGDGRVTELELRRPTARAVLFVPLALSRR